MKNHLKDLLTSGKVAVGAQLRLGVPAIAELFAIAGFDFIVLDSEHAPQTPVGIQAQLQAVNGFNCTPIIRFGRCDPDEIRLMLDMGAGGVTLEYEHPKVEAAVQKVLTAAQKAGKPSGVSFYPSNLPSMRQRIAQGARVLLAGGDEWMLQEACQKMIESAGSVRG